MKSASDWYKDYSNSGSWNKEGGAEAPADQSASTNTGSSSTATSTPPAQDAPSSTGNATNPAAGSGTPLKSSIDAQSFKDKWAKSVSSDYRVDGQSFKDKWGTGGSGAQSFKDKWSTGMHDLQAPADETYAARAKSASDSAQETTHKDKQKTVEKPFDTAKWGYYAGSNPYTKGGAVHTDNSTAMIAGLDYGVRQDRQYWDAKANVTRAETFGDVWKMDSPTWNRWDDPKEIKPTWQDNDDD